MNPPTTKADTKRQNETEPETSSSKKPKIEDNVQSSESEVSLEEVLQMNLPELELQDSLTLHKHLKSVDPDSANRLHPNNKRKIVR